mgnify:CR=1 FL=1
MLLIVVGLILQRNLVAVVVLSGAYSFLTATVLVVLDAVDVAMTEAAVGAGLSIVLVLATLYLTKSQQVRSYRFNTLPLIITLIVGAFIAWGTIGFPNFGDPASPMQEHIAPYYLANSLRETRVPNVVTAILASYRGYDTLGETTVIFTAAIGVLILLSRRRRCKAPSDGS